MLTKSEHTRTVVQIIYAPGPTRPRSELLDDDVFAP
jgi:hypothetical protein